MTSEEKIIAAVQSYNQGTPLIEVIKKFKCSKSWLYKWLKRFKSNPGGEWFKEQSRRPKKIYSKINKQEQDKVIEIRKQLSSHPFSQTGAVTIQYELLKQGFDDVPAWRINRILKRANLTQKPVRTIKRTNDYPHIDGVIDQMDFVGPRYIYGGFRYYSLNIIDTSTHYLKVNPILNRETRTVMEVLINFWKEHGLPDYIQMDNELSFRGSNKYPHSLGSVVRLALHLKVNVIFIPIKEPWRNGIIENFNNTFDKRLVRSVQFENFENLKSKAEEFSKFHNEKHRYGANHNRTPNEQTEHEMPRDILDPDFKIPDKPLTITSGTINLIRFIRSNLTLDVFGEKFKMPKETVYSYVIAQINIEENMLYVFRDSKVIWRQDYIIKS